MQLVTSLIARLATSSGIHSSHASIARVSRMHALYIQRPRYAKPLCTVATLSEVRKINESVVTFFFSNSFVSFVRSFFELVVTFLEYHFATLHSPLVKTQPNVLC